MRRALVGVLLFVLLSGVVADELDDDVELLELENGLSIPPPECVQLASVHSQNAMMEFYQQTRSSYPEMNLSEACSQASQCEKMVAPFLTPGGSLKSQCYLSCSGNGICVNNECLCGPGFEGKGCEKSRSSCPGGGNCSGNGMCFKGVCECQPGFDGVACEKTRDCFRGSDGEPCNGHGVCHRGKCFCDPGFTDENCTRVSRCPNDCANIGFCLHGQCFCPPGRGGPDCSSRLVTGKCPNRCFGRGKCINGQCHCKPGHYGRDCAKSLECPRGTNGLQCSGKGSCHNGQCVCNEGQFGFHCDLESKCPGNGTCSDNGICLRGSCYCYPGYTGAGCEGESACRFGCNGKGLCEQGKCKCLPGYYGELCDEGDGPKIVIDGQVVPQYCPKNMSRAGASFDTETIRVLMSSEYKCPRGCSGSGVCLNGTCACLPGYDGADCSNQVEVLPCPNHCSYRGVCVVGKCRCMPPYSGVDCADTEDPALAAANQKNCPKECNGRGRCRSFRGLGYCACDPGYAGPSCEVEVPCPKHCRGRGVCDRGKCFCYPGFSGPDCADAAMCPAGCSKHGQCFYGKCFCDAFYSGEDCSKTPHCSKGCSLENGICRGPDTCTCAPGWTGIACNVPLQCPKDCSGIEKGVCTATETGAKCICKMGWTGLDCSRNATKCETSVPGTDCSNHGICLMGNCTCDAGYSGVDCSVNVGSGGGILSLVSGSLPQAAHSSSKSPAVVSTAPRFASLRTQLQAKVIEEALSGASAKAEIPCPNGCSNHGVCANGLCFCNPGHNGDDCSQAVTCPNDCSGNGLCKFGQCWCGPNHVGADCSVYSEAGRSLPPMVIGFIIASCTFFLGIVVGRKTIARSGLKFTEGLGPALAGAPTQLREPIA